MRPRIWLYYFKYAFDGITDNGLLYTISIGTISTSLLILTASVLLFVNVNQWIEEWGESLTLSLYLKGEPDKGTKLRLESSLKNLPGAEIKNYISKEKALDDLREMLGAQAGLLDGITKNLLPASYEVVFKTPRDPRLDLQQIKEGLEKLEGVDEVQYSEQWLERFSKIADGLKVSGLGLGGILCIAVLLIATNTTKLVIYSRRDEIEILKLVGATDWFIKIPFLIEGAIQGLSSSLIAIGVLFLTYFFLPFKTFHLFGLPFMTIAFLSYSHIILVVSLGLILGIAGSLFALRRFFRF